MVPWRLLKWLPVDNDCLRWINEEHCLCCNNKLRLHFIRPTMFFQPNLSTERMLFLISSVALKWLFLSYWIFFILFFFFQFVWYVPGIKRGIIQCFVVFKFYDCAYVDLINGTNDCRRVIMSARLHSFTVHPALDVVKYYKVYSMEIYRIWKVNLYITEIDLYK